MISVISGRISYRIQGNLPASLQVRIADHMFNEFSWFKKLSSNDNIMGKTSLKRRDNDEPGLESLLALDGEIIVLEHGCWVKIDAWRVERSAKIPQGVRYSLTLHDRNKQRMIGYDNAHATRERRRRFATKSLTWDHCHIQGRVIPYRYINAEKLMVDFWNDVDRALSGMNRWRK